MSQPRHGRSKFSVQYLVYKINQSIFVTSYKNKLPFIDMENEEKVLNPQESLRIIRETIDLAKNSIREDGFHFLLWGWLVVGASSANYYFSVIAGWPPEKAALIWLCMVVVGVPAAFIYEWRRERQEKTENVVRDWYGKVWQAFGISLILIIFLAAYNNASPIPNILVLVGFALFVSGAILRFRPLYFGAIAMWVAAVVCRQLSPEQQLLAQAAATALGYLVPGYMLNQKTRTKHA